MLVTSLENISGYRSAGCILPRDRLFRTKNVKNIEHTTVTLRDLFGSVFLLFVLQALKLGDLAAYWNIILYCLIDANTETAVHLSDYAILRCDQGMSQFICFNTFPRGEFSLRSPECRSPHSVSSPGDGRARDPDYHVSSLVLKFPNCIARRTTTASISARAIIDNETEWGEMTDPAPAWGSWATFTEKRIRYDVAVRFLFFCSHAFAYALSRSLQSPFPQVFRHGMHHISATP
jgi:hypothetical protein